MIDPNRSYEQESIARAMCAECVNEWLVYLDPNGDMTGDKDG
ncbi:NinF family protein [Salmonella enterica]|nr:NinF family protein [Salmonella enterica]EJJ4081609.1 NinF family protein [Salmonella enterica]